MKLMGEMLLRKESFSEIVMGNTALVRAMVEAGTRVVTSYPGSPTPEIATAIDSIDKAHRPFYFEFSVNEKVATEVAYGAAINGHLSTVFFKSVGLNVAADTFVQLSHMNIIGGMVVVLGDDPGANSSQNEQDNLHFAHLSYTPMLEPANPSEAYRFYKIAASLARQYATAIILRLTTHVCHQKEKVVFHQWSPATQDDTPRFDPKKYGPYIPIAAPLVHPMKRRALNRLKDIQALSGNIGVNQRIDFGNPARGVVAMGLSFLSLLDVLADAPVKPDILKLGIVYPLPRDTLISFLKDHAEVKVLEELDDVIGKEIKVIAFEEKLSTKIITKCDMEDWIGEYTPDKVDEVMRKTWRDLLPPKPLAVEAGPEAPWRPPQLCPGCGHRSAFYAIKQALSAEDITVADIGCHTLGFLPPHEMGTALMCMGASPGIGSGLSLFNNTRHVIAFLGDSTFFHAGLPGIVNAVFNKHPITLVLMENGTTAMTGHQNHPACGKNFNDVTERIPVRQVLEGLGVKKIYETDTYQQARLAELVRSAVAENEFSVVIARHPCMLKFTREQQRKPDYRLRQVAIDPHKCEKAHVCIERFGCPTFTRVPDGRIEVNKDLCIGDGSCIKTCPVLAIKIPSEVSERN